MLVKGREYYHGVEINVCVKEDLESNTALMFRPWEKDHIFVYNPEVEGDCVSYKALMLVGRYMTNRTAIKFYNAFLKRKEKSISHDYKFNNDKFINYVAEDIKNSEVENYPILINKFLNFGYDYYPNKKDFINLVMSYFPLFEQTVERFMIKEKK